MAMINFRDFVTPFGGATKTDYAAPAATSYGNLLGALAQASSYQRGAEANAAANKYGSFAGGLGSLYGNYASLLGNNAASGANAFGGLAGSLSSFGQGRANSSAAKDNAYAGMSTGLGGAFSNLYGSQASALQGLANAQANESTGLANAYAGMQTGLANALANTYSGYAGGLGNLASAMAAQEGARYNSNAMAEAARQAGLANIASSALGAYGSASGSAMGALGQAESAYQNARSNIGTGYMNALGGLGSANQAAVSGLGQSRNNALGNLGAAYANAAAGLGSASVAGDLDLSFSDGGGGSYGGAYNSSGPYGSIASGNYDSSGGGGLNFTASRNSANSKLDGVIGGAFGGLNSLSDQLEDQRGYAELAGGLGASQNALRSGFDQAVRDMRPDYGAIAESLGSSLSGLRGLSRDGYSNMNSGMDQFYANQDSRMDYGALADALTAGYRSSGQGSSGASFKRSDFSPYLEGLSGGLDGAASSVGMLADRGFGSVGINTYDDSDLLSGLYEGYGNTMGTIGDSQMLGTLGLRNSANAIESGYELDAIRADDVAGEKLAEALEPDPYRRSLIEEYRRLAERGGPERFDPRSEMYDPEAARRKAFIESQLRRRQFA